MSSNLEQSNHGIRIRLTDPGERMTDLLIKLTENDPSTRDAAIEWLRACEELLDLSNAKDSKGVEKVSKGLPLFPQLSDRARKIHIRYIAQEKDTPEAASSMADLTAQDPTDPTVASGSEEK